jgi:hypothetical protein
MKISCLGSKPITEKNRLGKKINLTNSLHLARDMYVFTNIGHIIRQNLNLYVVLNLVYYGLVIGGMIAVSQHPEWEQALKNGIRSNFNP